MLSNLSFSLIVHITSFWKRQRIPDFDTILYPEYFTKMEQLIWKSSSLSFKLQMYFESSVSFSCIRFLNGIAYLLYQDVNSVSLIPKQTFVGNSLKSSLVLSSGYRQFCWLDIYCLMDNCFYSNNCMFYHLFYCQNLLHFWYECWLCLSFYPCNYN